MARFTIDLNDDIDRSLTEISKQRGISKAEAMRRAFAFLEIANEAKDDNQRIGIFAKVGDKLKVVREVVVL